MASATISVATIFAAIIWTLQSARLQADLVNNSLIFINSQLKLYENAPNLNLSGPCGLKQLNPIDYVLQDLLPQLNGQRASNENGTRCEFEEYLLNDESNDDAARMDNAQLIERSGFKYEQFKSIADDGYVTIMTRLINPLVDPKFLRQPPILMEHGGTIDSSTYLVASSIQHHPERYPRRDSDGPITSWNRSLAFVLANHGFDVWIAETRGSNEKNLVKIIKKPIKSVLSGENEGKNMTSGENVREVLGSADYWSFTLDDIIAHEFKSHIDTVLGVTGASKVHLMTYSLSTPSGLAFLSSRPDYADRVQGFVSMAPVTSGEGQGHSTRLLLQFLCPLLPDSLGTLVFTDIITTQPTREAILLAAKLKALRYSVVKAATILGLGSSPKYQTALELNALGHILRHLSFKEAKHYCQIAKTNKLRKFDFGPVRNMLIYGKSSPPDYDLSHLRLKDWLLVTAQNDALSTPQVVRHFLEVVNPKPATHVNVVGFNHMDLFLGVDNDVKVNMPILRYFKRVSDNEYSSGARSLELDSILNGDWNPLRDILKKKKKKDEESVKVEAAKVKSEVIANNPFNAVKLVENLQSNLRKLLELNPLLPRVNPANKSADKKY